MSQRRDHGAAHNPTVEQVSREEARALATIASRLDRRPRPTRDPAMQKSRLHETIRALGCVQLDTISVVSRSHETVLWSRIGAYDPTVLASLHYPDGLLTEYWAHYVWEIGDINGGRGIVLRDEAKNEIAATVAFGYDGDGNVDDIFIMRNPDKLTHFGEAALH